MPRVDLPQRRSIRLAAYNYRDPGAYFVTICTHERQCLLQGPERSHAVRTAWARAVCGGVLPAEYDFVVMPNHVHGIVWIARASGRARHSGGATPPDNQPGSVKATRRLASRGASPLRVSGCAPGSLGALVGAFKSASARRINELRGTPGEAIWQRSYYERVLRDERELDLVQAYILDNPRNWSHDKHNPMNVGGIR